MRITNDELLNRFSFSAEDMASIKLPGLPGTSRAWRDLLKASGWSFRSVRSRGRGGLKYEYEPPAVLLDLIRRHLKGEEVAREDVAAAMRRVASLSDGRAVLKNYRSLHYYRDISLAAGHADLNEDAEPPDALLFSEAWLRSMCNPSLDSLMLLLVTGDSMQPTLQPGSTVMIDTTDTKVATGIYAINLRGIVMIKRLHALLGGVIRVMSDNSAYDAFEIGHNAAAKDEFSIIGRVVWHAGAVL
jgi:phage repressor protein C with HTH and peptisase S24 domain